MELREVDRYRHDLELYLEEFLSRIQCGVSGNACEECLTLVGLESSKSIGTGLIELDLGIAPLRG